MGGETYGRNALQQTAPETEAPFQIGRKHTFRPAAEVS